MSQYAYVAVSVCIAEYLGVCMFMCMLVCVCVYRGRPAVDVGMQPSAVPTALSPESGA